MDIDTLKVSNILYKFGMVDDDFGRCVTESQRSYKTCKVVVFVSKEYVVFYNHKEKKFEFKQDKINFQVGDEVMFGYIIRMDKIPVWTYPLNGLYNCGSYDEVISDEDALRHRILDTILGYDLKEDQVRALYSMFGEEWDNQYPLYDTCRYNVPKMVKVWSFEFDKKSYRVAMVLNRQNFIEIKEQFMFKRTIEVKDDEVTLKIYSEKDLGYNYTHPGRELINNAFIDEGLDNVPSEDLWIFVNDINDISDRGKFVYLSPEKYSEVKRQIQVMRISRDTDAEIDQARRLLKQKMEQMFKTKKVEKDGFVFTKDKISYGRWSFSGSDVGQYVITNGILTMERLNFQELWNGFVVEALRVKRDTNWVPPRYSIRVHETTIKANKIKIHVKDTGKNKYSINDHVVNNWEVEELVKSGIKYKSQKKYDDYLAFTTRYNLTTQSFLETGIVRFEVPLEKSSSYRFDDDDKRKRVIVALPIRLDSKTDKLVVTIGDKEFQVKNQLSFHKLLREDYLDKYYDTAVEGFVKQMFKSVVGITHSDIVTMIKVGAEKYIEEMKAEAKILREKVARSRRFIKHAAKITNAIRADGGWVVTGKSGQLYIILDETGAIHTAHKEEGGKYVCDKYLCIVDVKYDRHSATEYGKNDKVARMMIVAANDTKLADEIYSKGDKMDRHWLEIMR